MSIFTYTPDRPATESSSPRTRITRFGTAEHRATFGINPFRDTWNVSFSNRSIDDISDIHAFLSDSDGRASFTWTTPFDETAQFVCSEWTARVESCNYRTIEAEFELRYDAGTEGIAAPAGDATMFIWIPDFTADLRYKTNAQTIQLGDGYTQRFKFGLNAQEEGWSLQFRNRTNAERNAIRTFLRQARGRTAFNWTDPLSSITGRYVCAEWSATYNNHNNNDLQMTLRRVFEP